MLSLIAFSKDRPAQLDLLLRSVQRFVGSTARTAVVYTASDELYERGYRALREEHPGVTFADEREAGGFKAATLGLLAGAGDRVAFLVDDIVFTHPLDLDAPALRALAEDPGVLCCSLRLDPGKDYCYALDRPMTPPATTTWTWADHDGDWGYPMSLDGHVFRTAEIRPLLERLDYANPNVLEAALAAAPLALPRATCFDVARLVNVPDNRVQDTAPNRHAGGSARMLAATYLAGRRLDLEPFDGLRTPSVHHEMPLRFAQDGPAPRVSVVIPCHNMAGTLAEAVHSVRASELSGEIEVIVVDDGSTDGSADVARELDVVLLQQPASGHPAHARNAGFAAARGDYVLPLDADDRIQPGFLAATVAALDVHLHAGFAYGDELDFGAGEDVLHTTPPYDFATLTRQNFLGSATLVRRDAWELVGGYDADLGYEDWDLWIALGHAGRHGFKAAGAVFEHRVSDDGRWAGDIARDREIKAAFVLKRPELYAAAQVAWARAVLAGEPTVSDQIGVIPTPMPSPAAVSIDARQYAVAALADELVAHPELLQAYGRAFDARDDITLVIYGDGTPDEISSQLAPVIAATGLEREGAPDLLAVLGGPDHEIAVAARAVAFLSGRPAREPFAALPRFDGETVGALREVVCDENGFEVPADMAWAFGPNGFYEQDVTLWFDRLMERSGASVVYDVGANCGWFAVRAARAGAAVRAFEPVPGTADVLERNLRGAGDARIVRAAVGEEPGTALMHLYSSSGNNSLVERNLPPGHALRHTGRHDVDVVRLDDVVGTDGFPAPELVKIDVEGFELNVLRGARETLRRHQPALLLEWSQSTCRDAGYDRADLVGELEALGYDVFAISTHGQLVQPATAGDDAETLVATPPGFQLRAPAPVVASPQEQFVAELEAYRAMPGAEEVRDEDLNPQLNDRLPTTPYDQHYFFQDIWAARRVADLLPARHVDVGSRVDLVGFLTAICPVTFVDIRPLEVDLEDFESLAGSILDLPFADQALESVSCLHVAEHIGLGRYGDPLDPHGTRKAAAELQRVLAVGGQLLFSGPVGQARTCFNAHRVHDPRVVVEQYFSELELVEFSGVDDAGVFRRHRSVDELAGANYACGMFRFVRPEGDAPARPLAAASPAPQPMPAPAIPAPAVPVVGGSITTVPLQLADGLTNALGLQRAVETGTYMGSGTTLLASVFGQVTTIELSEELHRRAVERFADMPHVEPLHGDSGEVLGRLVDVTCPTFWYLDGHWSGDITAGENAECPLLAELAALENGHPDDCIVIDDARFFLAAPPPPHRPEQWPTLLEIVEALRRGPVPRHVTLLDDQIIAVPASARGVVDAYGRERLAG